MNKLALLLCLIQTTALADATLQGVKTDLESVAKNLDTLESKIDFKGSAENELLYVKQTKALQQAIKDFDELIKKYDESEKLEALLVEAETLQVTIAEYVQKGTFDIHAKLREDDVNVNIEVGGVLEKIIKNADLGSIFGKGKIKVNTQTAKWNQLGKLVAEFRVRMQRIKAIDESNSRYESLKDWARGLREVSKTGDIMDRDKIEILPFNF